MLSNGRSICLGNGFHPLLKTRIRLFIGLEIFESWCAKHAFKGVLSGAYAMHKRSEGVVVLFTPEDNRMAQRLRMVAAIVLRLDGPNTPNSQAPPHN